MRCIINSWKGRGEETGIGTVSILSALLSTGQTPNGKEKENKFTNCYSLCLSPSLLPLSPSLLPLSLFHPPPLNTYACNICSPSYVIAFQVSMVNCD